MGFLELPEFMLDWPFIGGMAVLLTALIGLMLYVRSQPQDWED